jgi:hypothetical protein
MRIAEDNPFYAHLASIGAASAGTVQQVNALGWKLFYESKRQ